VSGIVYQNDSTTPAKDVILYFYHTDQTGVYPTRGDEEGWGKRHGYLRGWIKTNENGQYKLSTLRPASYPDTKNPQHIHITVKEPGLNPYWIDEYLFDDDPFLTANERRYYFERGGDGILKNGVLEDGVTKYKRNIVLGLNIPGYE
jgi:protocatechuate 3,4-dioxygenase beta subunit